MSDDDYKRICKPVWVIPPAKDAKVVTVETRVDCCTCDPDEPKPRESCMVHGMRCAFCGALQNSLRGHRVVKLDEHGFCAYCCERGVEQA